MNTMKSVLQQHSFLFDQQHYKQTEWLAIDVPKSALLPEEQIQGTQQNR
jgi:hypothetical protein